MGNLGLKTELRDGNTIRAYLDELVLRRPRSSSGSPSRTRLPFETTIVRVARDTFTTAQTPPLPQDQQLNISFMVDARRFTAHTQVVSTGVFKIPASVAVGERRERFRAAFSPRRGDRSVRLREGIRPLHRGPGPGRPADGPQPAGAAGGPWTKSPAGPGEPAALKRGDTLRLGLHQRACPTPPPSSAAASSPTCAPLRKGASAGFLLTGPEGDGPEEHRADPGPALPHHLRPGLPAEAPQDRHRRPAPAPQATRVGQGARGGGPARRPAAAGPGAAAPARK